MQKNKVICLSGGLDSTILTYKLVDEFGPDKVKALTFQYGQRHDIEIQKAKITCEKLQVEQKIIDITFLGDLVSSVSSLAKNSEIKMPTIKEILGHPQPVTYVPFRNMIFLSLALSFAESNEADSVYISSQQQDLYAYYDNSQEFIEGINNICKLNRLHDIKVITPFIYLSKTDEILIGQKLNVPFEDSWTCYSGPNESDEACSTCPSCSERIQAFIKAKIPDKIKYSINLDWNSLINEKNNYRVRKIP
jgi:7-cyano-7-deazaguanine synthase